MTSTIRRERRLNKQIKQVTAELENINIGRRGRQRRRGQGQQNSRSIPTVPRQRTGNRRYGSRSLANVGDISITRTELVCEVKTDANGDGSFTKYLGPDTTNTTTQFPFLSVLSVNFERFRFLNLSLHYVSSVGSTTDGTIAYGVDWNSTTKAPTLANTVAQTPSCQHAVWVDTTSRPMHCNRALLQSKPWYDTDDVKTDRPGTLLVYASGSPNKTMGTIWARYTVQLAGTNVK